MSFFNSFLKNKFFHGLPETSNWQLCSRDLSQKTQAPQAIVCIVVVSYKPTFTESLYATCIEIKIFHMYVCICSTATQKQTIWLQSSISLTWEDAILLSTTISIAKPSLEHLFCHIQSYYYIVIKQIHSVLKFRQDQGRTSSLKWSK